jgi:hypothetical protein
LKKCTLVLHLKQSRKLYNFCSSKLFQFHFATDVYFHYIIFYPWLREEKEMGRRIPAVERKTCCWHRIKPPKWMIFVSNYSILIRGVHIYQLFLYLESSWKKKSELGLTKWSWVLLFIRIVALSILGGALTKWSRVLRQ